MPHPLRRSAVGGRRESDARCRMRSRGFEMPHPAANGRPEEFYSRFNLHRAPPGVTVLRGIQLTGLR